MRSSTAMIGRNGQDQLARTSYLAGVICLILSLLTRVSFLSTISLLLLGYALFRMYSRNIAKRRLENEKYLKLTYKPRRFFRGLVMEWKDRKSYKYYSCPNAARECASPKGEETSRSSARNAGTNTSAKHKIKKKRMSLKPVMAEGHFS